MRSSSGVRMQESPSHPVVVVKTEALSGTPASL